MSEVKDASHLPRTFVAFIIGRKRPFKYVSKNKADDWDVHTWDGSWQFFDNVGDNTALMTYNEALIANNLKREPACIGRPDDVPAGSVIDIVISGRAGAGKSTLAYAIVEQLRSSGIKALIDPIGEDDMPGVISETLSHRLGAIADRKTPVFIRTQTT